MFLQTQYEPKVAKESNTVQHYKPPTKYDALNKNTNFLPFP
jgi:hypothetical protein